MYNPNDWYWLAEDGRVYSSKTGGLVASDNAAFVAWKGDNARFPTIWPRDANDDQTEAALQTVLGIYPGLFAGLTTYAANKRWEKEVGGITVSGMLVATDDRSKLMIAGARTAADADEDFTTPWAVGDTIVELDATQIIALSDAVLAHVQNCFSIFATVIAG